MMDRKISFWTGNDLNITVFILFLDFLPGTFDLTETYMYLNVYP